MARVSTDSEHYKNIADAIRAKTGETKSYYPSEMAEAITNMEIEGNTIIYGTPDSSKTYTDGTLCITNMFSEPSGVIVDTESCYDLPGMANHISYKGSLSYSFDGACGVFDINANAGSWSYYFIGCKQNDQVTDLILCDSPSSLRPLGCRLPHTLTNACCTLVGTDIYVFGGSDGENAVNEIVKVDLSSKTTTLLAATLPKAVENPCCIYVDGLIFVMYDTDVITFDPRTDTIRYKDTYTLPYTATGACCATDGKNVYILGADTDHSKVIKCERNFGYKTFTTINSLDVNIGSSTNQRVTCDIWQLESDKSVWYLNGNHIYHFDLGKEVAYETRFSTSYTNPVYLHGYLFNGTSYYIINDSSMYYTGSSDDLYLIFDPTSKKVIRLNNHTTVPISGVFYKDRNLTVQVYKDGIWVDFNSL